MLNHGLHSDNARERCLLRQCEISIVCDNGKIRANECRGKFICTMLSAAEFG